MFTATLISPSPERLHSRCCASAVASTQRSRRMIRSLASAAGMKSLGWQQAVPGTVPAHERLDRGQLAAGRIDHRLVLQEQPFAAGVQRAVQVLLELGAGDQRPLHRLVVDLHARGARVLGAVDGQVGAGQQLGGVVGGAVEREGDADAGADADAHAVDVDRLAGGLDEARGDRRGLGCRRRRPRR